MKHLLGEPRTFPAGPDPAAVELRDVNGDGRLDAIIVQNQGQGVVTLLGAGDGTFASPLTSLTSRSAMELALGDFNGDARLDAVVPNSPSTAVLFGDGNGAFAGEFSFAAIGSSVATGDVDRDGALDIVTLDFYAVAQVHLGDGRGRFTSGASFSVASQGSPRDVALVDVDENGVLDLAFVTIGANTMSILAGNGDGTFGEPTEFATDGSEPWSLLFADWNEDGHLDAATCHDFSGGVSVLLGAGDGSFGPARTYPSGFGSDWLAAPDVDADGHLDLVLTHSTDEADGAFVSVFAGAGDGTFGAARAFRIQDGALDFGRYPTGLSTGDLDEDGLPDVVVSMGTAGTVTVLLATPFGHCEPAQ